MYLQYPSEQPIQRRNITSMYWMSYKVFHWHCFPLSSHPCYLPLPHLQLSWSRSICLTVSSLTLPEFYFWVFFVLSCLTASCPLPVMTPFWVCLPWLTFYSDLWILGDFSAFCFLFPSSDFHPDTYNQLGIHEAMWESVQEQSPSKEDRPVGFGEISRHAANQFSELSAVWKHQ